MAKIRIAGTAGKDRIDLTSKENKEKLLDSRFDGFEVFAGDGADDVIGSAGHDILRGEAGDDRLAGGAGNDLLVGGAGNDTLIGGDGIDTASYAGQTGYVSANLETGIGRVYPAGVVSVFASEQDTLSSIENLTAGDGGSRLVGNAGDNVLTGGAGVDVLIGGAGNDTLIGGRGNDTLDGGDGIDTVSYAGESRFIWGNLQSETMSVGVDASPYRLREDVDVLTNIENIIAGDGGSLIGGDDKNNVLTGGAGQDRLYGNDGADTLIGGAGDDYLNGGQGDDMLDGGSGNDWVVGREGDDVLLGGDGADHLFGGDGNDTLTGGAGVDTFYFREGYDGISTVADLDVASAEHDVMRIECPTNRTSAEALERGYITFVEYGTPGTDDFGTMVMVDYYRIRTIDFCNNRESCENLIDPEAAAASPPTMALVLQGVEASALGAEHFVVGRWTANEYMIA